MVKLIHVYNNKYERIGSISNDTEKGIMYYDDVLTTSIDSALYTFEFKIPKTNTRNSIIAVGNLIEEFTPEGKQTLQVITSIKENTNDKTVFCEDASINMLNGYVDAIEPPKTNEAISYYVNHIIENTGWNLGLVQSEETLKLEFGQQQRRLERILQIAKEFGVEVSFDVDFEAGSPPTTHINFLKERVEDFKGFRVSSDDLLLGIERNVDLYNVITKLKVRGAQQQSVSEGSSDKPNTPEPVKPEPRPEVNTKNNKAIQWAHETGKRRLPYTWGGNGPNGYDCSGFVVAAWRAAGVSIPGRPTTQTMWNQQGPFKRISQSELVPGDLIMYDTGYTWPGDANHVGIYLGDSLSAPNSVIHAGNPVGIVQRANSMSIVGYIRVIQ